MIKNLQEVSASKDVSRLNALGLFPGRAESEEQFQWRVSKLLKEPPHLKDVQKSALRKLKELYDIEPRWIDIHYDNKGISSWEGAATFIDQEANIPHVQLRKEFQKRNDYLGIYSHEELLAHEMVHAVRAPLNSTRFEELIAYKTAKFWLRKTIGPIFETPKDAILFIASFALSWTLFILVTLFPKLMEESFISYGLGFLIFFPVILFGLGAFRLIIRRHVWRKCIRMLEGIAQDKAKARAIAFRLTDQEIECFARSNKEDALQYINSKKNHDYRWQVISKCYLNAQ